MWKNMFFSINQCLPWGLQTCVSGAYHKSADLHVLKGPKLSLMLFSSSFYFMFRTPAAMLSIHPDRSQFFWYETITLSCEGTDNSGNWTLKRNTSSKTAESCISGWGVSNQTSCTIVDTYASDTGTYWCESDRGECSETINITVKCNALYYLMF